MWVYLVYVKSSGMCTSGTLCNRLLSVWVYLVLALHPNRAVFILVVCFFAACCRIYRCSLRAYSFFAASLVVNGENTPGW